MNHIKIILCVVLMVGCYCYNLQATPRDSIRKKRDISHYLQLSGHFHAGANFYKVQGIPARRDAWSWVTSGNINLRLFNQIDVPLSFTYSRQRSSFSTPLNQLGVSPRYKWLTLHAGYRNLSLSPDTYTLNGRTIRGLGVEINRRKFALKFLKGQFRVPRIARDTLIFGPVLAPGYERRMWAAHIHWGDHRTYIEANMLHAMDDTTEFLPDTTLAAPAANLIPELAFSLGLSKRFRIYSRAAASIYTRNMHSQPVKIEGWERLPLIGSAITPTISSRANLAVRAGAELSVKAFRMAAQFERVDPYFESMGLYYMQDDKENYTLNLAIPLGKSNDRLSGSLSGTMGLQRNNIKSSRSLTTLRKIGQAHANLSYRTGTEASSAAFYVGGSYRNYQVNQENGLNIVADTLRIASLTQSGNFFSSLNWGSGNTRHSLSVNWMGHALQDVHRPQLAFIQRNYQLSYRLQGSQLDASIGTHLWEGGIVGQLRKRAGASLSSTKRIGGDKLIVNLHLAYSRFLPTGTNEGFTWNVQARTSYKLSPKQYVTLRLIQQQQQASQSPSFKESRMSVNYSIRF